MLRSNVPQIVFTENGLLVPASTAVLNGAPQNYIQFQGNNITIKANGITINGDLTVNGKITATDDIKGNGTSLHMHTHPGVQTGGSNTGEPN